MEPERTALRLQTIRDLLVSYSGNRVRTIKQVPPLGVWQAYELMKEGITPEGIRFYLKLSYPDDFNNPVVSNLLDSTLRQACEEYVNSAHLTKYDVSLDSATRGKN